MKKFNESLSFYDEAINLIDLDDYEGAINSIKKNIYGFDNKDDIALAYLNCGFLNDKLGNNLSALDDFSMSISFEAKLDIINQRVDAMGIRFDDVSSKIMDLNNRLGQQEQQVQRMNGMLDGIKTAIGRNSNDKHRYKTGPVNIACKHIRGDP